jgi:predicted transcriptional regulator
MILTQEEVEILKQLKAAGGTGRSVGALNAHDGLKRLIKVGYVEDYGTSFDLVSYRITKRGEDALSEALRFM